FEVNGLMFWNEHDIKLREHFRDYFAREMQSILIAQNPAWRFFYTEAPLLTPRSIINKNYTNEDVFIQERSSETETELVLRPETTPGSYVFGRHLLESNLIKPPFVVWQA